jgi:hypothetical protein
VGVFRVRLSRSAQSGSARQVLQSLRVVGQTRVMGDMVHMVESCVKRAGRCWGLWINSGTMAWIIPLPLEPGVVYP